MKTIHNINHNISGKGTAIRIGLIIAGIATAIICAMALVYEVRSIDRETINFTPAADITPTTLITKTMNNAVVSVIGPF
ncbi:MAG TPA: hypothetical protein PLJ60_11570 [Chryseolinea sp.]|nr:hypothetical protein [Chryseolinea sp.]HPM30962.1 hypothetical protein [Chryseolinea sp.]